MTKTEAHELLNAAQQGMFVKEGDILTALWLTGDLKPIRKRMQRPQAITHAVPSFTQSDAPKVIQQANPKLDQYVIKLPAIVHKPFALESA